MKPSDALWLQKISRMSTDKKIPSLSTTDSIAFYAEVFLEETLFLVEDFCRYLNETLEAQHNNLSINVFKFKKPRLGIMLLRGSEKLVISMERSQIVVCATEVRAYNEATCQAYVLNPVAGRYCDVQWIDTKKQQRYTPDMIVKDCIGAFAVSGVQDFLKTAQTEKQSAYK